MRQVLVSLVMIGLACQPGARCSSHSSAAPARHPRSSTEHCCHHVLEDQDHCADDHDLREESGPAPSKGHASSKESSENHVPTDPHCVGTHLFYAISLAAENPMLLLTPAVDAWIHHADLKLDLPMVRGKFDACGGVDRATAPPLRAWIQVYLI